MRTLKTLVLAAVIAISCTLSAYATETTEVEKAEGTEITKEIGKLLNIGVQYKATCRSIF